jgi:endonuclease YncB( thermonuclease family)
VNSHSLHVRAGGVLLALVAAVVAFGATAPPEELVGTPVRIFDGDSFVLRTERRGVEVRLADVDAPEHGQPYAGAARSALDRLIWKQRLRAVVIDEDIYDRKVCRVYRVRDRLDVNEQLVRDGLVWVYRHRVRDMKLYDLEREARRARRGLWALPERDLEPPWRWRREHPQMNRREMTQPQP